MTLWKLQALILCAVCLMLWGFSHVPRGVKEACASPNLDKISRQACRDLRGF
jgi:Na+/phosphate symporter